MRVWKRFDCRVHSIKQSTRQSAFQSMLRRVDCSMEWRRQSKGFQTRLLSAFGDTLQNGVESPFRSSTRFSSVFYWLPWRRAISPLCASETKAKKSVAFSTLSNLSLTDRLSILSCRYSEVQRDWDRAESVNLWIMLTLKEHNFATLRVTSIFCTTNSKNSMFLWNFSSIFCLTSLRFVHSYIY